MEVCRLEIHNFRGIRSGTVMLDKHTVLIGTNNSGKSTIIDALAMVVGRDKMVRNLSEHDFFGSSPAPDARIQIIVSIIGFPTNEPSNNSEWFRDGRAVPKWWNPETKEIFSTRTSDGLQLCAQIGFAARFDHSTLSVEYIRYFHDSDDQMDPFATDFTVRVPGKLLTEFGLFMVPVSRTWDRMMSFGSELFRRLVASNGGIPSEELLRERDSLRMPAIPLESTEKLGQMISNINNELFKLLPNAPELKLRVTATDSESLLNSIIPHYQFSEGMLLPASHHGTGLLSLQTMMLLLEFGRHREELGENFVLAIEEPELHIPPGIQRRFVFRAHSVTAQTIMTSHSPNVVAYYPATSVRLIENNSGELSSNPLLNKELDNTTPNGIRKLFLDKRQELVAALMHEYVLIPEGRIDYEWLRLLTYYTETSESWEVTTEEGLPFGTVIGVVPTQDAAVVHTHEQLRKVRSNLVIIVDGDREGDRYTDEILASQDVPRIILQWPKEWTIEDIIVWILSTSAVAISQVADILECGADESSIRDKLKSASKLGGAKGNYILYEDIASVLAKDIECLNRTRGFLTSITNLIISPNQEWTNFEDDRRTNESCFVKVWRA